MLSTRAISQNFAAQNCSIFQHYCNFRPITPQQTFNFAHCKVVSETGSPSIIYVQCALHHYSRAAADHIRLPIHMDSKLMTKFHITNCALIPGKNNSSAPPARTGLFLSHSLAGAQHDAADALSCGEYSVLFLNSSRFTLTARRRLSENCFCQEREWI